MLARGRPGDPLERAQVLADVKARLHMRPSEPVTFDRYVMLGRIGSGGGGVVFKAYDPMLDRRVAIKLIRTDRTSGSDSADARANRALVAEAQALARLSHPNVVAVHDVRTYDGPIDPRLPLGEDIGIERGVYMVMELVEGCDLASWLREERRGWREVVRLFLQAGHGLAAAHAHGVIHRDFKPANVLLGLDGRVRVSDFGLARVLEDGGNEPDTQPAVNGNVHGSGALLSRTVPGVVRGTPPYMAPEQHLGRPACVPSDIYAFCVALYEGLYGRRPFRDTTLEDLSRAKLAFRPTSRAPARDVPAALHRLVTRGLAPEPDARPQDMAKILTVLDGVLAQRRRAWIIASVAGAAALGLTLAAVAPGPVSPPCEHLDREVNEVWSPGVARSIADAFGSTQVPYAGASRDAVLSGLDAYADRWIAARAQACHATLVFGTENVSRMSAHVSCLDHRLRRFAGLVRLMERADAGIVARSAEAVAELPDLSICLREPGSGPVGALDGQDSELGRNLADAEAAALAASHERAASVLAHALPAVRQRAEPRMLAHALLVHGRVELALGRAAEAERAWTEAIEVAERAGDDEVAIDAMLHLVEAVGVLGSRYDEARRLARLALARIDRAQLGAWHESRGHAELGAVMLAAGAYDDAKAELERALLGVGVPDGLLAANIVQRLGALADRQGDYPQALLQYERALAIRRRVLGDDHPDVAMSLSSTGIVRLHMGDTELAAVEIGRALQIYENSLGQSHSRVAHCTGLLAIALGRLGRTDNALELHRREVEITEREFGTDSPWLAEALDRLTFALLRVGAPAEARAHAERAVAILSAREESPALAHALLNLAAALADLGREREAIDANTKALALQRRVLREDHPDIGHVLRDLGRSHRRLGELDLARDYLEEALRIHRAAGVAPVERARAELELARALSDAEPERARTLAESARDAYAASTATSTELRDALAFLEGHSSGGHSGRQ